MTRIVFPILLFGIIATAIACGKPLGAAVPGSGAPSVSPPASSASNSPAQSAKDAKVEGTLLTVAPEGSEVRYRVREQLADHPLPGEAVGATKAVTGSILIGPDGAVVPEQSKLSVDLRTLRSDDSRRDNFLRRDALESSRFPTAELAITEARGLPWPLPASGAVSFQLIGDLNVRGVKRPTVWDVSANLSDKGVTGHASTTINFADFNLTKPRVFLALSIQDTIRLEIDFQAVREDGGGV